MTGTAGTGGDGGEGGAGTGGGGGGETGGAAGTGGGGGMEQGYTCPEDPEEGEVREECGIWVSDAHGSDLNEGTQAAPLKTIGAAIKLADAGPMKRVYACGEVYPELVRLPAGTSLLGGFAGCDGAGNWQYKGAAARATLLGLPDEHTLVLEAGDGQSLLADLEIISPDAVEPGGSSITVFAPELASAVIRRTDIIAGNGADGLDGEPGDPLGVAAPDGVWGLAGADACTANAGTGGPAVMLQCETGVTAGGQGGAGNAGAALPGGQGFQPPSPNPFGYGIGGKGEGTSTEPACTPGSGGAQGEKGADGFGPPVHFVGELSPDGRYLGVSGGDGKAGKPGQGGGGGGASLGSVVGCNPMPSGGAGGGSGGTGGCGGRGGKGGQAGGSSFGIAARGQGLFVEKSVTIYYGNGGKGGNGGALQLGGLGGLPGQGGMGFGGSGGVKAACAGGAGGNGGNGGSGGGGHGGHSVGIVMTLEAYVEGDGIHVGGQSGLGGDGGQPGWEGGKGGPGTSSQRMKIGG